MCSGSCSNGWSGGRRPANGAVVPGATLGRQVVEGVLWILRTGAQCAELPKDKFLPYQTCHRRFQRWVREGTRVQHKFVPIRPRRSSHQRSLSKPCCYSCAFLIIVTVSSQLGI